MTTSRTGRAARSKVTGLAPDRGSERERTALTRPPVKPVPIVRESADYGWLSLVSLRRALGNQVLAATAPGSATAVEATQEDLAATMSGTSADTTSEEVLQVPPGGVKEDPVPDLSDTRLPDEEMLISAYAPGPGTATRTGFADRGQVGTVPAGALTELDPVTYPRAFVDNGITGIVVWAGGGGAGAHGNEGAGTIQHEVEPVFVPAAGTVNGKFSSMISPGTGKADVTRSYVGIALGDQGNGWFVTAAAAVRINNHETQHVASSRGFYTANIDPLLTRVANAALGKDAGDSPAAAVAAHKAAINWVPSITAFKTSDANANKPMGTVDTADLASGTYPVNAGPATVAGKAYMNVLKTPGEGMPAP